MRPSRTITISLPPELAAEFDETAREEGRSRSEVVREALRQYLARRARWDKIFEYGEQAARSLGLTEADVVSIVKESRRARRSPKTQR